MSKAEGQQTGTCPLEVPGLSLLTSTASVKLCASSDPAPASWSSSWLGSVPAAAYWNYQVVKAELVLPKEVAVSPWSPECRFLCQGFSQVSGLPAVALCGLL